MSFIRKFSRRDLFFCLFTGLASGLIAWRVFGFLGIPQFHNLSWAILIAVMPVLWIFGVLLGYFLGQWLKFFDQFGRFVVIGFTNTGVDFGVLNLLIAYTGFTSGRGYAAVKTLPFIAAMLSSYALNKFWTFSGAQGGKGEFGKFVLVTVSSFLVNVGISTLVATFIKPVLGLTPDQWANVAAAAGVAIGLIVNFLGFKFAVFKK